MNMKKGFTFVELLAVVAIVAVIAIILVPSIMNINESINKRLLSGKIEDIESAAILYANNNEEIFNAENEVVIYVWELINAGYLPVDVDLSDSKCNSHKGGSTKGCVLDPTNESVNLNEKAIVVRKEGAGVSASYVSESGSSSEAGGNLIDSVCSRLASGTFVGHAYNSSNEIVDCVCDRTVNATKLVIKGTETAVNACILAGENVNNYLRYGDSKANWRVIGLYYNVDGNNKLSAKIITSDPI